MSLHDHATCAKFRLAQFLISPNIAIANAKLTTIMIENYNLIDYKDRWILILDYEYFKLVLFSIIWQSRCVLHIWCAWCGSVCSKEVLSCTDNCGKENGTKIVGKQQESTLSLNAAK